MTPTAHYNSSKLCWEIWMEQAQGDRFVKVLKHADVAHIMLKDQGVKFVDAAATKFSAPMLLICDYRFWSRNEEQILDWCSETNVQCKQTGMVLEFDSTEDKMMFMLRWV